MVREAAKRRKKFEAGIDGDAIGKKFDAQKEVMVEGQAKHMGEIVLIEQKVKALVEAQGVSSMDVAQYLNAARKFFKICSKFSGSTRDAECQRIHDLWLDRGLNSTLLVRIAQMCGCTPTPGPTPGVVAAGFADIKVYPWCGDAVLDADPDFTYTPEVSEAAGVWTEVGHFDFNEDAADIKSIFVNLVWAQKITGTGAGRVKWQLASGSNAAPGAYADITDEIQEVIDVYADHGRSGVVQCITGTPAQTPFTIRCLVRNVTATSAEAKIKSNSYIRVAYKRVS